MRSFEYNLRSAVGGFAAGNILWMILSAWNPAYFTADNWLRCVVPSTVLSVVLSMF